MRPAKGTSGPALHVPPATPPDHTADLLRQLCQLCETIGRSAAGPCEPLQLVVRHAGLALTLSVQPVAAKSDGSGPAVAAFEQGPQRRLRRVERNLLAAATVNPTPAKKLAAVAGYKVNGNVVNSYVRTTLCDMVRRGLLAHGPDGYSLPG
jgi:hypothetical protein